jgi:AAA15 family ATPase/GTPase
MNIEELNKIAKEVQNTKQEKKLSKRELVNALGFEKRTSGNCINIDSWLNANSLETCPSYKDGSIDENMTLCYKYKVKSNNFQLYYIEIKGYKNLVDFSVDFEYTDKYCCFIGLNGSGKSNVLEAISLVFFSLYHIATLKDGLKKYPCKFHYTIRYILNGNLYEISDGKIKGGAKITLEILPKNIIASYSGEDTRLWKECYKPIYEKYCSKMVATAGFRPPFMFYLSRYEWEISLLTLLYSEDVDVVKFIKELIGDSSCNISFEYNTSNIRKWEGTEIEGFIDKLREKPEYSIESFRDTINDISFIDQASTLFYCLYKCRTNGDSQIIKRIIIDFGDKGSIDGLSEGEKKLINANVIIHILSTKDSLCLFDEPDAHIHIGKQRKLRELIDTNNRYSLVTTHSPVFLDMLYNDCNIRYMNEGKALNTEKLKQINTLSGGEINYFEGAFILSSKKILITEGKYDGKYLKKAVEVFSKVNRNYLRLNDVAIIQAGGASNAIEMYEETIKSLLPQIEKLVFLFDYDKGGFQDGWDKINRIKGSDGKIVPLFYQHNYSTLNTTKPGLADTVLVEDMFSEVSYASVVAKVHVNKHKEFRNIQWDNGIKGTANAIKNYIEKNYSSFDDVWYDGFQPVLDKLIDVFDLN